MQHYRKELEFFVKKWYFTAFVVFLAVVAYGFSITHPVVNIDTLSADFYVGSGQAMLRAGRFGMTFWSLLLGYRHLQIEHHFTIALFSAVMLIWAGINFCILLRRASRDSVTFPAYMVFCGFVITHPIINEIWEYQGANLIVCGGYLFVSIAIIAIYDQIVTGKLAIPPTLLAVFCLTIVCSSYESLAAVYVFFVLAVLFMQQIQRPDWKKHMAQGIGYCLVLVLALICRSVISKIILMILDSRLIPMGETSILWGDGHPFLYDIARLLYTILQNHILGGLFYYPVGVTVVFAVFLFFYGVLLLFRKNYFAALLAVSMVATLEILSVIRGAAAPYRTCQACSVLCGFAALLLVNRFRWKQALACGLCFLCLHQATYLSYLQTLNYQRYEEEMTVVNTIGTDLQREHDLTKKVVFVGGYRLSDYIMDQTSVEHTIGWKISMAVHNRFASAYSLDDPHPHRPNTNIQGVLGWATIAFESQDSMQDLFHYQGYDIQAHPDASSLRHTMLEYVLENRIPPYPQKGYIAELDDLIVINLNVPLAE